MDVVFSGTDAISGIAACTTVTYNGPDGTARTLNGSCSDNAGNSSSSVASSAFDYDATAPAGVSVAADRSADSGGYFNHSFTATWTGTDATSGIDSCTATPYSGPDTNSGSISGSCTDKAGNTSGSVDFTFKYDSTPPSVTLTPDRGADHNGWYNHSVTFTVSGNDATSGGVTCDAPIGYSGPDNGSASVTGHCTDAAGNTGTKSENFQYDATAPGVTVTPDRAADSNGWYNHSVTFTIGGTDSVSGLASCDSAVIYSGPDTASHTVTGHCLDNAGNDGSNSASFKYDGTAPTGVSGAPNRSADHNGWYNHAVDVVFSGTDALSGIASCTTTNYTGPDGSARTVNGTCTDDAGNSSAPLASSAFDYDATAPTGVSGAPDRAPDHNDWFNHSVNVVFTGTDATSGIDSCSNVPYSTPDSATASVNGSCTDKAGNSSASVSSSTFKFDASGPTAGLSVTAGTAGLNGWYTSDVTVHASGSDSISSPVTCTADQFQTVETAGAAFNGSCTNDAGLTTNASSLTIKLDETGPSASLAVSAGTLGNNGWYVSNVTISTSGSDSISSPVVCTVDQYQTADTAGTAFNGSCTNNAGLTTNAASLTVKRDATPPTLNPSVSPNPVVLNGSATASAGANDATSGIASSSCGALSLSSVGSKSVNCTATDNAGNTNSASASYSVVFASGGVCYGDLGHSILQPINFDGTSVFKQGSTVPQKFRVCDANGVSIGTPGVVAWYGLVAVSGGTVSQVNEVLSDSSTNDLGWRFDPTAQQWIYNLSTKLAPVNQRNQTYGLGIKLADGTWITYAFGLR